MKWISPLALASVLSASLSGCSSPDTSSGVDDGEPGEIHLLHPADVEYVRRWIGGYVPGRRTSVNTRTGTVSVGPDWNDFHPLFRAAALVHEACHVQHKHKGCNPEAERQCSRRSAEAMERIGEADEAQVWNNFNGEHC